MSPESEKDFFMTTNHEALKPKIEVTRISDGLEFGEGNISLSDRLEGQAHPLDRETVVKVESVIESEQILVAIDMDDNAKQIEDDGCGDGRGVKRVFSGVKEFKRSLNRAKVFGGGLTMAVATAIGKGRATGKKLKQVFSDEIDNLDQREIAFGAHTDDHASGDNSGCGAIDKAPTIIDNVVKYQEPIRSTIKVLTQGTVNQASLDSIINNFEQTAIHLKNDTTYSGKEVSNKIVDNNSVIKELAGPHLETHIVINTVRDYTVDQDLIRRVSDGKAQVFAVDAWRLQDLANKLEAGPAAQEQAYLSMLAYTLGTAATLTKGDLPIYIVTETS